MVASKFLKDLKAVAALTLCGLLAACGGAGQAPVIRAPAPQDTAQQSDQAEAGDQQPVSGITEADESPVRIAILLPLTGTEAETGQSLLNAATMALFDAYDPRLTLLPFDTKADGMTTDSAARQALEASVDIVLGPLLAGNVQIAGQVFGPAGIPVIGFSNDSRVAEPGRYILGFLPEEEVQRVVDYAVSQGHSRFSALIPEGRYGARVRAAFGDAVSYDGAAVVALESYPPDPDNVFEPVKALANYDLRQKNLRDEISALRALRDDVTDEIADRLARAEELEPVGFDAVLVPEGGALLRTLGPLLPFYEVDLGEVQLLGTGLWNDPSLMDEPPLHGGWFAAPEPARPEAFMTRYEELFGSRPPRIASIAYDAMSLVAALSRDTLEEGEERFSAARLTSPTGFVGIDGLFRLNRDGLNERALAILEVSRREFKVLDPAPTAFPSFGYQLRQSVSRE
ncbi:MULTISPECIES: penicillin-binding protein activator [Kordiimonas]|jgi:hypothetical protein|uniref:penicillin-binding protein activator n=1 Tax=Kordiimonas TaxID=288021 RepID=UPI002579ECDF|nr:penicillin-binding protein activator [Kordiimonas sp. UBA4487]